MQEVFLDLSDSVAPLRTVIRLSGEGETTGGMMENECEAPSRKLERERDKDIGGTRHDEQGDRETGREEPKRFTVAHIKESGLIESLRGVCSSLLIWLNIPD